MTHNKVIGIDARLMYQTGVGVYIRNLIYHLAILESPGMKFRIYARKEDIASMRLRDTKLYRISKFTFVPCDTPWHSISEQVFFWWQLWKDKLDLMHFPYFSWPVLYRRPFIATIHDTILLTHATGNASTKGVWIYRLKHVFFRFVLSEQVKRARSIIVPSNTVKEKLMTYYPDSGKKIQVMYEGVDSDFIASTLQTLPELEDKRYFLYVGNCYPHKNVDTLMKAFVRISQDDIYVKLCIVGPDNYFSQKLKAQVKDVQSILFLHNISASELKWLYTNAQAFIFPSLAEGFGLPIVEAQYCGCPLILSDIEVMREVARDNAHYFSPLDDKALYLLMKDALNRPHQSSQSELHYSFNEMTKNTLQLYKDVLGR